MRFMLCYGMNPTPSSSSLHVAALFGRAAETRSGAHRVSYLVILGSTFILKQSQTLAVQPPVMSLPLQRQNLSLGRML